MAEATELDRVFHVLLQNRGLKGPGELGNAKVILVLVRQLLGSYDPVITYTRPHDPHYLPPPHHITAEIFSAVGAAPNLRTVTRSCNCI